MKALSLATCFITLAMPFWTCPARANEKSSQAITADTSLSEEQASDALKESARELQLAQQKFESMFEKLGTGDPQLPRAKAILAQMHEVHALKERLLPLLAEPRDDEKQKVVSRLVMELHALNEELNERISGLNTADVQGETDKTKRHAAEAKSADGLAVMRKKLELAEQQLAQRQKQLTEFQNQLMEQMAQQGHARDLPPLENAELKIFSLKSLPAPHAANAIEDLFGPHAMRVSIDDRSNSLIVLGKPDSIKVIEALLMNLDQKQAKEGDKKQPQSSKAQTSRPLQLRLFWLADGVSINDGKDPAKALPASVLRATEKLGLVKPRLVTQSVLTMAVSANDATGFSAYLPAILANSFNGLSYGGKLTLDEAEQVSLAMHIESRQGANCELEGSLTMPLRHYMVLGTSDTFLAGTRPKAGAKTDAATPVAATGGPEGEFGFPGAEGAPAPQAEQPKSNAMRFAFVVQVDEAESFAPEE